MSPERDATVMTPLTGTVMALDAVPDPAFAGRVLGEGVAILPEGRTVLAPVTGMVTAIIHAGHAVGFTSEDGLEVLVHVGIDTVRIPGVDRFFRLHVQQGQRVRTGQRVATFDLPGLVRAGAVLISPVVVTAPLGTIELLLGPARVRAGLDVLFRVRRVHSQGG